MRADSLPIGDDIVRTQLEDLQSEMEAGARTLETIAVSAHDIRAELLRNNLEQAHIAGALVRRIRELQACVREQRRRLGELRRAIRNSRR